MPIPHRGNAPGNAPFTIEWDGAKGQWRTNRGTDLSGKTVIAPFFRSDAQRCEEPEPED